MEFLFWLDVAFTLTIFATLAWYRALYCSCCECRFCIIEKFNKS